MSTISAQIYSKCTVPAMAGTTFDVTVEQDLKVDENAPTNLLQVKTPNTVQFRIEGPQFQLPQTDVVGMYPAAGSEDSADEVLPHIVLKSCTLPWERHGNIDSNPWLALVVFRASELPPKDAQSTTGTCEAVTLGDIEAKDSIGYAAIDNAIKVNVPGPVGTRDATPLNVVYVKRANWENVRPDSADIKYLTHIRETTVDNVKTATSTVICNRLPSAGNGTTPAELHTALLISIEGRDDLFTPPRTALPGKDSPVVALVVLQHWTFRPSKGGDFEQVMRAIGYRPNGGVLRFGNLPQNTERGQDAPLLDVFKAVLDTHGFFIDPLEHTGSHTYTWRGPLRPFAVAPRSDGFAIRSAPEEFEIAESGDLDCSHATAFELGRLLALTHAGVLEDLKNVRTTFPDVVPKDAVNPLPDAIQRPDWVSYPAWSEQPWFEQPWTMRTEAMDNVALVKDHVGMLAKGKMDVSGIPKVLHDGLTATLTALDTMPQPSGIPVAAIDMNNATSATHENNFPEVHAAAQQ